MKNKTKTIIWSAVTAVLIAAAIWFSTNVGRAGDIRPAFWSIMFLIGWTGLFLTWFISNKIWKHWNE